MPAAHLLEIQGVWTKLRDNTTPSVNSEILPSTMRQGQFGLA